MKLRHTALGMLLLLLAAPLAAQQVWVTPNHRGWIGVSFEVQTTQRGNTVTSVSRVTEVMDGSPAATAGLRPGDLLISANGRRFDQGFGDIVQALRPGDPLEMVVERDGRRIPLALTAGERPAEALRLPSWTVTVTADSMVNRLYMAMDSLRVRITEGDMPEFHITSEVVMNDSTAGDRQRGEVMFRLRRADPGQVVTLQPFESPTSGMTTVGVRTPELVSEVRPPFGFYVFRGATHDSLRVAMDELNQEIRTLRSLQAARTRELARAARAEEGRIDTSDPELRRLGEALEAMGHRADELRAAMETAARREARAQERIALAGPTYQVRTSDDEAEVVGLRPLAPYVLGANRAAGAEVVDLQPELAEYFQVEGGVLVVDVPAGTPAQAAGIQPGDVLTHIDGAPIRSITDLRRGMARNAQELPVTLVRKGRTLQVLLRR